MQHFTNIHPGYFSGIWYSDLADASEGSLTKGHNVCICRSAVLNNTWMTAFPYLGIESNI